MHHRNVYRPSNNINNSNTNHSVPNSGNPDSHVSRSARNNDRYANEPPPQHHHNNSGGGGGGNSSHFSPPVRRPYVGRGAPSNRISTTYRGRGTTYGRGTSIRRPYGSTLNARSSAYGTNAIHANSSAGGGGGAYSSSYVRPRTTAVSDTIRRKVLVPRVSTATDLARKLKIAKLRRYEHKHESSKPKQKKKPNKKTNKPPKPKPIQPTHPSMQHAHIDRMRVYLCVSIPCDLSKENADLRWS